MTGFRQQFASVPTRMHLRLKMFLISGFSIHHNAVSHTCNVYFVFFFKKIWKTRFRLFAIEMMAHMLNMLRAAVCVH